MTGVGPLPDSEARHAALNVRESFIVQAPAGSGKTELLIQRILALLARVRRPEEILAITFTRKAAGEMHSRLLEALAAAQGPEPESDHGKKTWRLARAALTRDAEQGWRLSDNPARLQIRTIDGFNAWLLRGMPWVTRCGGMPELAENATPLYRLAAERILARMESGRGADAVSRLAAHVDNRLDRLRDLLVAMLQRRDQWLRHLVNEPDQRERLEATLQILLEADLQRLSDAFPVSCCDELLELVRYAAANLELSHDHPLSKIDTFPTAAVDDLGVWQALAEVLLTSSGSLRKKVDKRAGFPVGPGRPKEMKERMQAVLETLTGCPEVAPAFVRVRALPVNAVYPDEQWDTLKVLLELLPLAVAELWLVFREQGLADFSEISLRALQALEDDAAPTELLLKLDATIEHILVDEFQDTSHLQFRLLELLTSGWQPDDGRTLFLVGDPMQSIYRFREAEVGLFLRVWERGIGSVTLTPLRLSVNFRSSGELVDWFNRTFRAIFPVRSDQLSGAVPYAEAEAIHVGGVSVEFDLLAERDDDEEARQIVALIRSTLSAHPDDDIALLVRSRNHLTRILPTLRDAGLSCQAHDIDPLAERPVVRDLRALMRALLQPADRLSWLTLLRAPWCGLSLVDLAVLCGEDRQDALYEVTNDLLRLARLSADGHQRLLRVLAILEEGRAQRRRIGLRRLVESCWLRLGAPACYRRPELADAERILTLLEQCDQGGDLLSFAEFDERLSGLYAGVDASADTRLHVMTIHKAKGLEFATVIVPGCGRSAAADQKPLLRWLEHPESGLLLAPFAPHDADREDPIFRLIGRLEKDKHENEVGRLLYVAATRARERLVFTGAVRTDAQGDFNPETGSFLDRFWPLISSCCVPRTSVTAPEQTTVEPASTLRRLHPDWQPAALNSFHFPPRSIALQPSLGSEGDQQSAAVRDYSVEMSRSVGTLVHRYFERIATEGVSSWLKRDLSAERAVVEGQLLRLGVPQQFLAQQVDLVVDALTRTLSSPRGQWILDSHPSAVSEWALSGVVAGDLVHAIIDRSFIVDGVRWVIDYKLSSPADADSEGFLAEQLCCYRDQLTLYSQLAESFSPELPVRAALYFPFCDGWIEATDR